ncbi:AI-2E family transporter [Ktedonosporobacter rubrisoli]|uniref:AI-2E family transporter n=1 Tax=Ktedonosporobacter rubrisoli TaxID=2509675 RepID=A0A4P6JV54_KTERU|nr:AI-2E family transporter [Ktedonosporobacter rubrisoli]QBD79212.1 AI-2E family transporter [Ktedonosporobacter rubrisoli]
MAQIDWHRTRDILICIICFGVIVWALGSFAGQFIDVIIILLLSMAVAFLLTPAANLLARYHVPRVVATLIVYIIMLALLGALGYALVFSLIQQALNFSQTITDFALNLPTTMVNLINFLETQGHIPDANIRAAIDQIQLQATDFARSMASNVLNFAFVITNGFIDILLVIVISFYLTLDGKRIRDSIVSIMPKSSLPHVLLFEDALNRVVGNYIRGQLTLALIVGCMASLVCVATGLQNYAYLVGVLAFIFETIPMVGPALASIPAIALSLLLPDPFPRTFYIVLAFVAIQAIESNILGPRIVGHAVGLHPVASLLALLIGAKLLGPLGALIATPIVAAIWVVVASLYRSIRGESADQILAKRRRASWVIRRPPQLHMPKKRQPLQNAGPEARSETDSAPEHTELFHVRSQQEEKPEPSQNEEGEHRQDNGDRIRT